MHFIMTINKSLNSIVWGWPMIILLLGTGILLFIATNGLVIRNFNYIFKSTFLKLFKKDTTGSGELTAFQAVSTALAATVGTGNIVGVATAISIGGPGAIFWLWVSAFFGMTTKFAEVTLAIAYREKNPVTGAYVGGPMYYLKNGVKCKALGSVFAIFSALAALGIGNMTQANSISMTLKDSFGLSPYLVGFVLIILTSLIIIRGINSIGKVTEKLVPFMAIFYILACLFIIFSNINKLGPILTSIFANAFNPSAAAGGIAGISLKSSMKAGISRGLFSNEAGLGSGPIAHAASKTDHPVRQGLWGVFEVLVDSFIICSLTSFVILISDNYKEGLEGAAITTQSFNSGIPYGAYIVSISLTLFAFSTIIGWYYYGEKSLEYLFGSKGSKFYKLIYLPIIFLGAVGGLKEIWSISDTMNGLMAIPNLIGLIVLTPTLKRLIKNFFEDPDRIRQINEYEDLLR